MLLLLLKLAATFPTTATNIMILVLIKAKRMKVKFERILRGNLS